MTGNALRSYRRKHTHRRFLVVSGLQRDKAPVHEIRHALIEWRQQKLANANVVDQPLLLVDHVDDVQGLAVLTVDADVIEDLANRPVIPDGVISRPTDFSG